MTGNVQIVRERREQLLSSGCAEDSATAWLGEDPAGALRIAGLDLHQDAEAR